MYHWSNCRRRWNHTPEIFPRTYESELLIKRGDLALFALCKNIDAILRGLALGSVPRSELLRGREVAPGDLLDGNWTDPVIEHWSSNFRA